MLGHSLTQALNSADSSIPGFTKRGLLCRLCPRKLDRFACAASVAPRVDTDHDAEPHGNLRSHVKRCYEATLQPLGRGGFLNQEEARGGVQGSLPAWAQTEESRSQDGREEMAFVVADNEQMISGTGRRVENIPHKPPIPSGTSRQANLATEISVIRKSNE